MALFNFGKKKEKKTIPCGCNCTLNDKVKVNSENCNENCNEKNNQIYSIKVLGAGCKSCHQQYENVKEAVKEIGISVEVEYITDMQKVMEYGVMSMPAIVVNEKVISMGKVLKTADVKKLLTNL